MRCFCIDRAIPRSLDSGTNRGAGHAVEFLASFSPNKQALEESKLFRLDWIV